MRYNRIKTCDTQNTDGLCVSLWLQGCPHRCEGCWNKETWSYDDGILFGEREVEYILDELSYKQDLAILGGEPLIERNLSELTKLCIAVKNVRPDTKIWLWTGYIYEDIKDLELLKYIDILIDGKFEQDKKVDFRTTKNNDDKYRGSSNQIIINLNNERRELYNGSNKA